MPRCERCTKGVPSFELKHVRTEDGKTVLACKTCRTPTEIVSGAHEKDKQIAAISLHQYETADGKPDYMIRAEVDAKGVAVKYETTIDDIRQFFKHGGKKQAELKAV